MATKKETAKKPAAKKAAAPKKATTGLLTRLHRSTLVL